MFTQLDGSNNKSHYGAITADKRQSDSNSEEAEERILTLQALTVSGKMEVQTHSHTMNLERKGMRQWIWKTTN